MSKPEALDLFRTRGDTYPTQLIVKDENGVIIDITGFAFILTVDPSEEPIDALANLFALTGTIVDGPAGAVSFAPSVGEANQTPSEYYYDVQMTDLGGAIRTITKGRYTFLQDITK